MIVHTNVTVDELAKVGKAFNWNRPSCCNGCPKMWSHGFVGRYFEGFADLIWLQRWRCPECGCVVIMMPKRFFRRFQTSIDRIFHALRCRLQSGRWPPGLPRQRAGHWLSRFSVKCRMDFPTEHPLFVLERLFAIGANFLV